MQTDFDDEDYPWDQEDADDWEVVRPHKKHGFRQSWEDDEDYPWDQEDADDWETMRPPRHARGGKRNHNKGDHKPWRQERKQRFNKKFERKAELKDTSIANDGSVYWRWQHEKDGKQEATTQTTVQSPKSLLQQSQKNPKVRGPNPTKVIVMSVVSVVAALGLMGGIQYFNVNLTKKMTKFNYLKSVHENENAVVVTPEQAKVIIEKMSTPHQSL